MPETEKPPPSTPPETCRDRSGVPWGSVLRNVLLVLVLLTLVCVGLNVRLPSLEALQARIAELGLWGPCAFIALYAVVAVTPIPVTIMAVAAGMIFGLPVGTVLSMVGVVLGCFGGYGLARALGRDTMMRILGSHAQVIEARLHDRGLYAVCTLQLKPENPHRPVICCSRALGVSSREFLIATVVSALPGQVSLIAIGAFIADPSALSGAAVVISWVVVIALTLVAYRRWRATRVFEDAPARGSRPGHRR